MTYWEIAAREILVEVLRPLVRRQTTNEIVKSVVIEAIQERDRGQRYDFHTTAYCLLQIVPRGSNWRMIRDHLEFCSLIW